MSHIVVSAELFPSDTKEERNALMERVYPKLNEFCKKQGYEFQVKFQILTVTF